MIRRCVLCQTKIIHELTPIEIFGCKPITLDYICSQCQAEFKPISAPYCPTCFKMGHYQQCIDCQYWHSQGFHDFHHQALYNYNAAMHDYFKRYKRYGDYHLRLAFRAQLQQIFHKWPAPFIYIPSERSHWQKRKFDPVVGIFKDVLPLTPALVKLPTDKPQAQKNRQQRLQTPQSFQFKTQYNYILQAAQITIIDDIYTTGRTIFHARSCLLQQGYQGVIKSFSLAR